MKQFFLSIAFITALAACNKGKNSYTITGKLSNLKSGNAVILQKWAKEDKSDTAYADKDGKFTFTGSVAEPTPASLVIASTGQGLSSPTILFLEKGTITIGGTTEGINGLIVTGGTSNQENNTIQNILKSYYSQMKPLGDSLQAKMANKDTANTQPLEARYMQLEQNQNNEVMRFIESNTKSYVATFYAYLFFNNSNNAVAIDGVYSKLDKTIQSSYFGSKLKEISDRIKSADVIGKPAPDFTLQTPDNQSVSLSSLKGKYVLVDFWASWCGPCRKENPNVVKAFNQFKDKNFTILGVSLDEDKTAWQAAIAKDKLTWTHVSDLKGWQSGVAALYHVESIPANFLLDKEGKIVAKDLRGEDLINTLNSLIK
ncbi:redoxin domain-containing protein [Parasediminibacterium paludis]|uniref:Redoxin domain-containing protein n=1 Tax=Parasediminibacterium paludis TaxID=908966 RepID=A0ABV8PVT8_9BACT